MNIFMRWIAFAVLGLLTGCGAFEQASEAEQAIAVSFLEDVIAGNWTDAREAAEPSWAAADFEEQFEIVPEWLQPHRQDFRFVASQPMVVTLPDGSTHSGHNLVFETPGNGASRRADRPGERPATEWIRAEVLVADLPDGPAITQCSLMPVDERPSAFIQFDLNDRSPIHFLWLLLMIVSVLTCSIATILVLRGPAFDRRWLWTIGCLFGTGAFSLNWGTGDVDFLPIKVVLLGAGFWKATPLEPFTMEFAIPVFALLFLFWKRPKIGSGREPRVEVKTT